MGNEPAVTARRRFGPWLPHAAAALVVAGCYFYGAEVYGSLPETVPTHWGLDGTPDAWEPKSFGTVFLPINMAAGLAFLMVLVSAAVPAMTPAEPGTSSWEGYRRQGSIRGTVSALGLCSVAVSAVIGLMTVAGWRTPELVPIWPVLALLPLVLILLPASFAYETKRALRAAETQGFHPTAEESAEEAKWVAGSLYKDAADSRILVSKRPGSGMGMTVNIGNRKGRAAVVLFLVLFVGLPLAAGVAAAL